MIVLELPDAVIEQIAAKVAALLVDQQQPTEADAWLRGADRIAEYIDAPRSRVYALASTKRIPVRKDGSALVARRSDLDAWLLAGGAVRP